MKPFFYLLASALLLCAGLSAKSAQCNCQPHCYCNPCRCGDETGVQAHLLGQRQIYGSNNGCDSHLSTADSASCHSPSAQCGWLREGVWLPEAPPLFKPFVADPRQVNYSAGWRLNDQVLVKNVIDVSYGDSIPFYRWCDVGPWHGQLQVELQGALWAVFDPLHESSPLMNADYYVGIPITYSCGPWAFRLRGYHISSHIGDEFLLDHPHFCRKNPSAEYLDFFASHNLTDDIRLYGGLGFIVHQDKSFRCGRFYAQAGAELHLSRFGFCDSERGFFGRPFFGMDFRFQTKQTNHINQTYALGYEWGNTYCLQRAFRLFIEYHDGYSYEGQFCHSATNYFSVRLSYGY